MMQDTQVDPHPRALQGSVSGAWVPGMSSGAATSHGARGHGVRAGRLSGQGFPWRREGAPASVACRGRGL